MSDADTGDRTFGRREVLKTGAAALATGVGVTNGVAAAGEYPHQDRPDHVQISTAPEDIQPWQPLLTWDTYPEREPLGYWGFRASSPEHDTDVVVGFHKYTQQEGISSYDSHAGDHEPIYVFFNPTTGDIVDVVCSGYHWYRMQIPSSSIRTVSNSIGEQPVLRGIKPWNHHLPVAPEEPRDGRSFGLESLPDDLYGWLYNGLSDPLREDQPYNPWKMRRADGWWKPGTKSTIEMVMERLYVSLGFGNVPDRSQTGWDR